MGAQEYFSVERTCSSGLDVGYGVVGVFGVCELDKIELAVEMSGKLIPPDDAPRHANHAPHVKFRHQTAGPSDSGKQKYTAFSLHLRSYGVQQSSHFPLDVGHAQVIMPPIKDIHSACPTALYTLPTVCSGSAHHCRLGLEPKSLQQSRQEP